MAITQQELGSRLRVAREAAGLTQEEVGRRLGVSRSSVAQMELGNRSVSSLELDELARLYGRDMGDFLARALDPEASLVAIFRADPALARADELDDAVRWCIVLAREFARLESLLGIDTTRSRPPAYEPPAPRSKWQAIEQGTRVAAEERRRLNLGELPLGDVQDLLESQGVRTALLRLPQDVSGLTLMEPSLSFFVVANEDHALQRRRFSWVHEYAHILFDRERKGTVSRDSERTALVEVRANAFAAAFLMPEAGPREFLENLGKGRSARERWAVFDGSGEVAAESRAEAGSQRIHPYDVVLLAHHFGVSRTAALYRLRNLRLISQGELDDLLGREAAGVGRAIERSLQMAEQANSKGEVDLEGEPESEDRRSTPMEFRFRFLGLAIEAFRRSKISRGKLRELAELVGFSQAALEEVLGSLGLEDGEGEVLLPEGLG